RPAILHFLARDALEALQLAFRRTDPGDAGTLVAEQELRISPSFVLFADPVLDGNFHVLEPDFVHFMSAIERPDRAHGDAGSAHIYEKEADTLLRFGCIRVGAHQAEDPVRVVA